MVDAVPMHVGLNALEQVDEADRARRHTASGWFGMWWLIASEAALFAFLLFSYFYSLTQATDTWPPNGPPSLMLALPNTFVLLASSVAVWAAEKALARNNTSRAFLALLGACGLGIAFVAIQLAEWHNKPFSITSDLYGSLYFTITGFHMAHVAIGLLMLAALAYWAFTERIDARRRQPLAIGAVYWHFVDCVWLAVFTTFYIAPYLR